MNPAIIIINLILFVAVLIAIYVIYNIGSSLIRNIDKEHAIKERKNEIKEDSKCIENITMFEMKHRGIVDNQKQNSKAIKKFINNGSSDLNEKKGEIEESINLKKSKNNK